MRHVDGHGPDRIDGDTQRIEGLLPGGQAEGKGPERGTVRDEDLPAVVDRGPRAGTTRLTHEIHTPGSAPSISRQTVARETSGGRGTTNAWQVPA